MRWPFQKKLDVPKIKKNGQSHSEEARRESEQKLRDAVMDRLEVRKVSRETAKLDKFAEAVERSMRRSHG
jgi:hypothetical protein